LAAWIDSTKSLSKNLSWLVRLTLPKCANGLSSPRGRGVRGPRESSTLWDGQLTFEMGDAISMSAVMLSLAREEEETEVVETGGDPYRAPR
jgi:hypothetical protein